MRTARPAAADTLSGRRAQPVRQTRANPPRTYSGLGRPFGTREAPGRTPSNDEEEQSEIYPAISHFADVITALPRELVRHFTLLKEVDAKIFAPEETLIQLVDKAINHPLPERPQSTSKPHITNSAPTSKSGPTGFNGPIPNNRNIAIADGIDNPDHAALVYGADNLPRRQLFRQCAYTMQEMLVSLDEKNHVISTATEALDRHLARLTDCLPYVEGEFSEEARYGSTKHWAYTENRVHKPNERTRRENANVNHLTNAAAAAAAEEAAARSDARKQAMLAKKTRTQLAESDFDDNADNRKDNNKKPHGNTKKGRPADTSNAGGTTNSGGAHGNPPSKRRKVEKGPTGGAVMERSMSSVYGTNGVASKGKANSPRNTPVPDAKKRSKAATVTNGQQRKRTAATNANAMSPKLMSSPVHAAVPDVKNTRPSPPPTNGRPTTMRARQNSLQNATETSRPRAASSASNKPNGISTAIDTNTVTTAATRPIPETKAPVKESIVNSKDEIIVENVTSAEPATRSALPAGPRKDGPLKHEDPEPTAADAVQGVQATPAPAVTTKSGRASKPSTPAMPSFPEPVRATSRRNTVDGTSAKRSHKKGAGQAALLVAAAQAQAQAQAPEDDGRNSAVGEAEEEEIEVDANEETYCYCNGISYGEMVACDADGCAKEWFHLECVGLKVAPKGNAKWYCDDCKENMKSRRFNGR